MTDESESTDQARFRFSLGGLFVFVFGCALGLSIAILKKPTWEHGILAAVATWCVFGLFYQCRVWKPGLRGWRLWKATPRHLA